GCLANDGCAATAASKAALPSSGEASATSHNTFPVDGSYTGSVLPSVALRHWPPMNRSLPTLSTTLVSVGAAVMNAPARTAGVSGWVVACDCHCCLATAPGAKHLLLPGPPRVMLGTLSTIDKSRKTCPHAITDTNQEHFRVPAFPAAQAGNPGRRRPRRRGVSVRHRRQPPSGLHFRYRRDQHRPLPSESGRRRTGADRQGHPRAVHDGDAPAAAHAVRAAG